jgi:hypothetical protein
MPKPSANGVHHRYTAKYASAVAGTRDFPASTTGEGEYVDIDMSLLLRRMAWNPLGLHSAVLKDLTDELRVC